METSEIMAEIGIVGVHFEKKMPEIVIKASTDFHILVTGETGTGKELVAKLIHRLSSRKNKQISFVNAPAINDGVFESELFGHKKGSFTNASSDRKGLLRSTSGGTVVLDEIGNMSLGNQAKILRWLESGEIKPVGSDQVETVDVRVIASTNQKLETLVKKGLFRRDLYYRLNTLSIKLLPLRDDMDAVCDLAKHFIDKNWKLFSVCESVSTGEPSGSEIRDFFAELSKINSKCSDFLEGGNARELESMIRQWLFERVYDSYESKTVVSRECFRETVVSRKTGADVQEVVVIEDEDKNNDQEVLIKEEKKQPIVIKNDSIELDPNLSLAAAKKVVTDELEKVIIMEKLTCYNGDIFRVAIELDVKESWLRNKIKKLKIDFHSKRKHESGNKVSEEVKSREKEPVEEVRTHEEEKRKEVDKDVAYFKSEIEKAEVEMIINALIFSDGNKTDASKLLERSYNTLYLKIKKYKIDLSSEDMTRVVKRDDITSLEVVVKKVKIRVVQEFLDNSNGVPDVSKKTKLSVKDIQNMLKNEDVVFRR